MYKVIAFFCLLSSEVALAGIPAALSDPWFWVLYPIVMIALRALSEVFLKAAEKTKAKWDNVAAKYFVIFVEILGKILGSFGFGKSKMLK